jgi:hypothetical protein
LALARSASPRRHRPSRVRRLSREEFTRRLGEPLYDPAFDAVRGEIERVTDVAWTTYDEYHKSPRTRKAGQGFADPEYELPVEWLDTRAAIHEAQRRHEDPEAKRRILLVSAAARSNQTCPGESPKTYRLAPLAADVFTRGAGAERLGLPAPPEGAAVRRVRARRRGGHRER